MGLENLVKSLESGKLSLPPVTGSKIVFDRDEFYPMEVIAMCLDDAAAKTFRANHREGKIREEYLRRSLHLRQYRAFDGIEAVAGEEAQQLLPPQYLAQELDVTALYAMATEAFKQQGKRTRSSDPIRKTREKKAEQALPFNPADGYEDRVPPTPEPEPAQLNGTFTLEEGKLYSPTHVINALQALIQEPMLRKDITSKVNHNMKILAGTNEYIPPDTPGIVIPAKRWHDFLQKHLPVAYRQGVRYETRTFLPLDEVRQRFLHDPEHGEVAYDIFIESLLENDIYLHGRKMDPGAVISDEGVLKEYVDVHLS